MIKPLFLVIHQDFQKVIILILPVILNKSMLSCIDKFFGLFDFTMFQIHYLRLP